jgi:hypothetical protein
MDESGRAVAGKPLPTIEPLICDEPPDAVSSLRERPERINFIGVVPVALRAIPRIGGHTVLGTLPKRCGGARNL